MSRKLAVDSVSRVDYLYESSQSSTSRRLVQTSRHVRVERLKKLGEYKYDASSRGRPNPFFPLLTWTRRRLLDAPVEPSSRRRPLDARRRGSEAPPSPAPRRGSEAPPSPSSRAPPAPSSRAPPRAAGPSCSSPLQAGEPQCCSASLLDCWCCSALPLLSPPLSSWLAAAVALLRCWTAGAALLAVGAALLADRLLVLLCLLLVAGAALPQ